MLPDTVWRMSVIVLAMSFACPRAHGTDYYVKWATTGPASTSGSFSNGAFAPSIDKGQRWRTIAADGGATILNSSTMPMRALHIKTMNATDRFVLLPPPSDKVLFREVWQSADGREIIFNGGLVQAGDACYSLVYPKTPNNGTSRVFLGRVSSGPIEVPKDGWEIIYGDRKKEVQPIMTRLFHLCPSKVANMEAYGISEDGKRVCFVSNGGVFVYEDDKTRLRAVVTDVVHGPINRIMEEARDSGQVFVLWRSGNRVLEVSVQASEFGKSIEVTD